MKRVELTHKGDITVYATNQNGGGVFVRKENDGAYSQIEGNDQTPTFTGKAQFRRYLYRMGVRGREVAAFGW